MQSNNIYLNFLRSRRSIRRFQQKPVEMEKILRVIETAMFAPSAHNRQPWRFVVIVDEIYKIALSEEMGLAFAKDLEMDGLSEHEINDKVLRSKNRIVQAPVIIILFLDMSEMDVYPSDSISRNNAERIMGIQSAASSGMLLQLAAFAENLASVWTCSPLFASNQVRNILGTPKEWEPQSMFFLGYSAETPKVKTLKISGSIIKIF